MNWDKIIVINFMLIANVKTVLTTTNPCVQVDNYTPAYRFVVGMGGGNLMMGAIENEAGRGKTETRQNAPNAPSYPRTTQTLLVSMLV